MNSNNWQAISSLSVYDAQTDYVAPNVYSLAEASFRTHCQPRAIYLDEKPVGFLMYAGLEPIDHSTEYEIFRFMVDAASQNQGVGRRAMELILILICYVPANPVAKTFYLSFGFIETGLDDHGEMMAEIKL